MVQEWGLPLIKADVATVAATETVPEPPDMTPLPKETY